jgi:hypothetical protein
MSDFALVLLMFLAPQALLLVVWLLSSLWH